MQGNTGQDKNVSYSRAGQRIAKKFENFSSDQIDNENRVAALERQVTVHISTLAQFCMQDTIEICCTTTCGIVF